MKNNNIMRIILVVLLIAVVVLYFLHFGNQQKMVYVDVSILMNKYGGMITARKAYQVKALQWQANVDTLAKELEQGIKDYEKERSGMTEKEKELSEKLLMHKQQQLSQYQEATKMKAQEEDNKMTEKVIQQVNAYIKEYGEKHNYKIILGATGQGNILYAVEGIDITDDVLSGLNKQYRKK